MKYSTTKRVSIALLVIAITCPVTSHGKKTFENKANLLEMTCVSLFLVALMLAKKTNQTLQVVSDERCVT